MHTMKFSREDRLWTVGYFEPNGSWHPLCDHETKEDAAAEVARLNGGGSAATAQEVAVLDAETITNLNELVSLRTQAERRALASLIQVARALRELHDAAPPVAWLCATGAEQLRWLTALDRAAEVLSVLPAEVSSRVSEAPS